nr:hypothetical protein [Tanacetum cinerariifolium]
DVCCLTNKGWVDGNDSNLGGGFRKPGGGRETRGDGDGLKGVVANYPWFEHRDHFVTFEVEEVLEGFLKFIITSCIGVDANDLIREIGIPTASDEFLLPKFIPTAMKKSSPCLGKEIPLLLKFALPMKTRVSHGQRHIYNIQRRMTVTQLS